MKNSILLFLVLWFGGFASAQDLSLGLVAYYPFDGNANDESVTNIDGVVNGAVLDIGLGNQPNGSYYFNGTNSYIDCGLSNRGITDIVTISYWIKTSSTAGQHSVSKYNPVDDHGFYSTVEFGLAGTAGRDGSGSFNFSDYSTTYVADGEWHHIVSVVNVNTWEVWVDCNLEADIVTATGSPDLQVNESLMIGKHGYNNTFHVAGNLDEIRIYNRVLTMAEITLLCNENQFFLGEEELAATGNFKIYPNPVSDILILEFESQQQIQLINQLGEIVLEQNVEGLSILEIDISQLPTAPYTLNFISSEGVRSEKLLIR